MVPLQKATFWRVDSSAPAGLSSLVPGSNPKQTVHAFSIDSQICKLRLPWFCEEDENKQKEALFGPHFIKQLSLLSLRFYFQQLIGNSLMYINKMRKKETKDKKTNIMEEPRRAPQYLNL